MEAIKGLELAVLLCIGLLGFIVFVMLGGFVKKNNSVYFAICGLFMLLALCAITYDSFLTNWAYIEGNNTFNIVVTILITVGFCAFFMGILYIQMLISNSVKYHRKAKAAGMSITAFKAWETNTINSLSNNLRATKKEVHYDELLSLYKAEEKKLLVK